MSEETAKPDAPLCPRCACQKLACVAALERDMDESEKKVDAAVAREEYGQAQYHKGCAHAYALASLRVKRIMTQANDPSSPAPGNDGDELCGRK